jgi:hypothetical protein
MHKTSKKKSNTTYMYIADKMGIHIFLSNYYIAEKVWLNLNHLIQPLI